MRSRGSTSSLLSINLSPGSLHGPLSNKLPQPKHYATQSPKPDDSKTSWIHIIALEFAAWISSHKDTVRPEPTQSSKGGSNRWVHYTALGLWRDASQDQIKRRYYELSKKHHPDVSQDPSSPETFRKVTEAYAVLGNKKARRKYDQSEQLHSALVTGLLDEWSGRPSASSPRPLDPTFWDPVKLGSSTFYRPPPGYWTAMNRIRRDREKEKSNAQEVPSSPQTVTPSHDRTEGNEKSNEKTESKETFIIVASLVFVAIWEGQEWILGCTRAFLTRLQQNYESESSAPQRHMEDTMSQATDA
ncbi:DnaJ domain-containing protein [Suillus paluster]|uniref:DnaJ domain-containing protein n=1 Tax=Suillus paluster TaxID=48578 RepID=UPI001B87E2AA|nr:DnaJ domain-containing protein [Suillus paluster]KAG1729483.1 DnaJ domain-containing protein [Suillus paluster]